MTIPQTLLITGTLPGTAGPGALYLRELCATFPHDRIACFCPTSQSTHTKSSDLGWLPTVQPEWKHDRANRPLPGRLGSAYAIFDYFWTRKFGLSSVANAAIQQGREIKVELVWGVLDSPVTYALAPLVANALGVPLVTTVWDPPDALCRSLKHGKMVKRWMEAAFDAAIAASVRCAVASENMQTEFARRFPKTQCIIMRHAPHVEDYLSDSSTDGKFKIGLSGSIYAEQEWTALIKALNLCGWTIGGRPASIQVYGNRLDVWCSQPADIHFFGWRSAEEVRRKMAALSCGYVPYWFDPEYADSVRLCFPTKLTTYLSCGLPVLFHGPRDSSPGRFVDQTRCGIVCDSLDPRQVADSLNQFAATSRAEMTAAGKSALESELNLDVFMNRFRQFLGTSPLPYHNGEDGGVGSNASVACEPQSTAAC